MKLSVHGPDTTGWLKALIGRAPRDPAPFHQALTHGSAKPDNYERLEFLGDRVLGLLVSEWVYERFAGEPEGKLSRRFNALVSGETCAEVARAAGVPTHLVLGKQARDDGAANSDNVLGDVMEALIGALYLEGGLEEARTLVRRLWADRVDTQTAAPRHPKSALQEWAAANKRKPPEYVMMDRSGPHHALRFTVTVSIKGAGEASATGGSKQEAETAAAAALLEKLAG
ncbi:MULTISPECIES: ribonuclease III [unclassified Sphingobium]|uniref:ribonuclease III n=1 Tax=unclassified Sphingobium TaxID=2611147 RepID=UPI00044C7A3D|nr:MULTISPECIES: ribonuclease III [unclassified Sphingobium]OHD00719.1 MAG: ribonuclease III [Sphingomonadales bacterium RIFCSPLOWO2_12_FULL_63_15]AOF96121.1 ribonuclease III [Sphingobium sp. RAC03]EXS71161.1 ribonuclease III [Sphingobium sp. Ant17]KFL47466.1 ribonuclease III [Sphingobium sp. ba1]MDT7535569.1 ribonuclease III [Sphingobium sp. SA2]